VAPPPGALAATSSEEEDVVAPPRCRYSHCADASASTSAVIPGRGPAVAAAGRAPSEVVVIDDDDDNDPRSGSGAIPPCSLPAPRTSRASVLRCHVPL
jgi:hypothetical protein